MQCLSFFLGMLCLHTFPSCDPRCLFTTFLRSYFKVRPLGFFWKLKGKLAGFLNTQYISSISSLDWLPLVSFSYANIHFLCHYLCFSSLGPRASVSDIRYHNNGFSNWTVNITENQLWFLKIADSTWEQCWDTHPCWTLISKSSNISGNA
jgi:hypothetical protein